MFNCFTYFLEDGFRIKLDTPEDIKKWREERRKNFPSSKRIEEKKKEEADKRASGAVLQEQSFGLVRFNHILLKFTD